MKEEVKRILVTMAVAGLIAAAKVGLEELVKLQIPATGGDIE